MPKTYRWSRHDIRDVPSSIFLSRRTYHTSTVVGNYVFVLGGWRDGLKQELMLVLDINKLRWHEIKFDKYAPNPRTGHTACLLNDQILMIGGWLGRQGLAEGDVQCFDIQSYEWSSPRVFGIGPGNCSLHSANYMKEIEKIVVFQGTNGEAYLSKLYVLNPHSMVWALLRARGNAPEPRGSHCTAVIGNKIYLFGGGNNWRHMNDLFVLSFERNICTWNHIKSLDYLPEKRYSATLTPLNGMLILFGGRTEFGGNTNEISEFDPMKNKWNFEVAKQKGDEPFLVDGALPSARCTHTAAYLNNKILYIGGGSEGLNIIYELSVE